MRESWFRIPLLSNAILSLMRARTLSRVEQSRSVKYYLNFDKETIKWWQIKVRIPLKRGYLISNFSVMQVRVIKLGWRFVH